MTKPLRCAIYTRKSSEEGLEQGFNSLHAQRESCEAYVLSQAGEGWSALPTQYDDGGFSGGSMERPGLQALLSDIRKGLVDVIVVYKVDRLTRSLADFARIVELFDTHGVSFVSVTQAFNTTTSMGRLTLNVLLSFAQFEREVTGERIRDKIAASKAKGLWMGGRPPLGYDGVDCKLVVNPAEAEVVRRIFERYLELRSVIALQRDLNKNDIRSKTWTNKKGEKTGGGIFSQGALYYLLANPVYRGIIRHRAKHYPDAHPAIVDQALWDAAQAQLAGNCPDHPDSPRLAAEVLLRDRLFDDRGHLMAPLHTVRRSVRYRYYASAGLKRSNNHQPGSLPRIAMGVIDDFVMAHVPALLSKGWRPDDPQDSRVRAALMRAELGSDRIVMTLCREAVEASPRSDLGTLRSVDAGLELAVAIRLKHRQGAIVIDGSADPTCSNRVDRNLVRAVTLARAWAATLAEGQMASTKHLARRHGLCERYAGRLMPLAWLAPDLVEMILVGQQPAAISLAALTRQPLPVDWGDQRRWFANLG